jgi:hypothetical protein
MKTILAAVTLTLALTPAARADQHADCPMATPTKHGTEVDQRHDQVTGVAHQQTVHHFLLAEDGGSIRLEVAGGGQTEARDRIRRHLQRVARSFAAGDFSMPMQIHDQLPPGADVMKERRAEIRYEYAPRENGGEVRIATRDARALAAVHDFLRFQIRDHGTGDPTE